MDRTPNTLKFTIHILAFVVFFFASIPVIVFGVPWASRKLLPWFFAATWIALAAVVLICLPLCISKAARSYAGLGIVFASYIFSLTLWMYSLLVVLALWGVVGVIVGYLTLGYGMATLGLAAAFLNEQTSHFWNLALLGALALGSRFVGGLIVENGLTE